MNATNRLPMSQRLFMRANGPAPRHLKNMVLRAAKKYSVNYSGMYSPHEMATWLKDSFSNDQIDEISYELTEEYKQNAGGDRAFKRGRPPGAKNRNSPTYNALDDLEPTPDTYSGPKLVMPVPNEEIDKALSNPAQVSDLSNYVTKREFSAVNDAISVKLGKLDLDCYHLRADLNVVDARIERAETALAAIKDNRPTIVELKRIDLPTVNMGTQHKVFPDLLMYCSAQLRGDDHLNIWIYGPAGTGKSTACKNVSIALFGKGRFYSNGKISYAHELLGHMHGAQYITTQFRQAYELGGVYCADEVDGWLPDALIALNGALANGHCAFPDGMIERHKDFIFIGAANTTGLGGNMDYVSRFKQDAAFNDRCIMLEWPLDEGLEDAMCANKDWLAIVRKVRANVAEYKIKGHLITPRAAIFGESLLAAGVDLEKVKISVLKKGMTQSQWEQATGNLRNAY